MLCMLKIQESKWLRLNEQGGPFTPFVFPKGIPVYTDYSSSFKKTYEGRPLESPQNRERKRKWIVSTKVITNISALKLGSKVYICRPALGRMLQSILTIGLYRTCFNFRENTQQEVSPLFL